MIKIELENGRKLEMTVEDVMRIGPVVFEGIIDCLSDKSKESLTTLEDIFTKESPIAPPLKTDEEAHRSLKNKGINIEKELDLEDVLNNSENEDSLSKEEKESIDKVVQSLFEILSDLN